MHHAGRPDSVCTRCRLCLYSLQTLSVLARLCLYSLLTLSVLAGDSVCTRCRLCLYSLETLSVLAADSVCTRCRLCQNPLQTLSVLAADSACTRCRLDIYLFRNCVITQFRNINTTHPVDCCGCDNVILYIIFVLSQRCHNDLW